jgi:hypothetical protein
MKILKVEPHKKGYVKDINNTLEDLQNEVGGFIQVCYMPNDIVAIVDEEGLIKHLEPNMYLPRYGMICGNIIFAKNNDEDFDSLTDEDIDYLTKEE